VQVELRALLDAFVLQQFQEVYDLELGDVGADKELEEEGEQVAEVALQVDLLQLADAGVLLGQQLGGLLEVVELVLGQHGLRVVHDDIEFLVLLPHLLLPDANYFCF
jgi:hypothetical protein